MKRQDVQLLLTRLLMERQPIICSPTDAFKCFMGTELDMLAVGNYLLTKEDQNVSLKDNYKEDMNWIKITIINVVVLFFL